MSKRITSFERKETAHGIFLDFAKAFDIVNHNTLINKLEYYVVRGTPIKWFRSYFNNRLQCVEIDNSLSEVESIDCGVPQGSVLGSILFLLYINDITESSNILKFYQTIFFSRKHDSETGNTLNL